VLVTGAGGLLGGRLAVALARDFDVVAGMRSASCPNGLRPATLDLLEPGSLERTLEQVRPDAIVHCAALADADRCEREPALATSLNANVPRQIARLCRERDLRLIALSTDLVFGGDRAFVKESDLTAPSLVYARTKLEGEQAVLDEAPGAAVIRVGLLCGRGHGRRPTASEAIAWALAEGRSLRLFTDQHRTPVDAESVAAAAAALLVGSGAGRYHLGGRERLSRYDLGLRVARLFSLASSLLLPVRQAAELAHPRPADVSLDSGRAERELDWAALPLDEAVRHGRPRPDCI
jgi:dTDP-4-dehydrorhamnose reductase